MSRPGFEPGPLAFRASALTTELSGLRIQTRSDICCYIAFKIGCHGFVFEVPIAQSVRALARKARGPGSNPGRDMLFFFAFLVGYLFII